MRLRLVLTSVLLAVLSMAVPAGAITNGERDDADGDTHDAVGQLLFYVPTAVDARFVDPGSWFSCSGTLVDEQVVVTAGHCTYAVGVDGVDPEADGDDATGALAGGTDVWISFAQESDFGILPSSSTYPPDGNAERYDDWSAALDASPTWYRATTHTHPQYIDAAFFLYDLGVLVLDESPDVSAGEFGVLPSAGLLDTFQTAARNDALFTAVGFGIQQIVPRFQSDDVRYEGTVRLLTTKGTHGIHGIKPGTSVVFSNNNGRAARGGTCFGDSGGPVFVGESQTIGAVTSYGVSPNCTGTGGGYRIDKAVDLAFIRSFLPG